MELIDDVCHVESHVKSIWRQSSCQCKIGA
jgi:hypothetical protein